MKEYGFYIVGAYATVFLGLLYMTLRYIRLHKNITKVSKDC